MDSFAAGIVPYIHIDNETFYLLGLEISNNLWSGFVGGSEKNETITETAFREFTEETVFIFEQYNSFIKSELANIVPYEDTSPTGKKVYIYFIKFPVESQENIKDFMISRSKFENECFQEKSILRWFTRNEIKNSNKILYKFKQIFFN